jgi:hypothetical protein
MAGIVDAESQRKLEDGEGLHENAAQHARGRSGIRDIRMLQGRIGGRGCGQATSHVLLRQVASGLVLTRRGKIFADSSPAIASSVAKGANDETGFLSGREDRGCGRSGVDEWFVRVGGMWFIRFIARQRCARDFGLDVQGESWAG